MARVTIDLDTNDSEFDSYIALGLSALFEKAHRAQFGLSEASEKVPPLPKIAVNESGLVTVTEGDVPSFKTVTEALSDEKPKRGRKAKEEVVSPLVAETQVHSPAHTLVDPESIIPPPPATVAPPPATVAPPPATVAPPPATVAPPPADAAPVVKQNAPSFTRISNRMLKIVTPTTPGYDDRIGVKKLRELAEAAGIAKGVAGFKDASEDELVTLEAMVDNYAATLGVQLPA